VNLCVLCGYPNEELLFPGTLSIEWFLGALAKFLKATITFVVSVCLSVRPLGEKTLLPLGEFLKSSFIFDYFYKVCRENQVPLKFEEHNGYFTWRPLYICTFVHLY
jgi:hypothetical protein